MVVGIFISHTSGVRAPQAENGIPEPSARVTGERQSGPCLTRPAMSTISRNAGTSLLGLYTSHSHLKRLSGTLMRAYACGRVYSHACSMSEDCIQDNTAWGHAAQTEGIRDWALWYRRESSLQGCPSL